MVFQLDDELWFPDPHLGEPDGLIAVGGDLSVDRLLLAYSYGIFPKSSRKDVAQKYIAYRNQRSVARKAKTRDIFLDIVNVKNNDITRENANMNADTPAGMMMKFASESTKPFVDDYLLSERTREAVKNNYLHIHDKDYYPTKSLTCVQHPLDNILSRGFVAGHGASRPAKRIETASVLACISLECAQNEMHGGQAIPAFDFYMAPFVRMTFQEVGVQPVLEPHVVVVHRQRGLLLVPDGDGENQVAAYVPCAFQRRAVVQELW